MRANLCGDVKMKWRMQACRNEGMLGDKRHIRNESCGVHLTGGNTIYLNVEKSKGPIGRVG